jgi:hypothetical protein
MGKLEEFRKNFLIFQENHFKKLNKRACEGGER